MTEILSEISAPRSDEVGDQELKDSKDEIIRASPAGFATANQDLARVRENLLSSLPRARTRLP